MTIGSNLHVTDIEQTGLLSRPLVRLADTQVAVLNGHQVTTKRNHLASM